MEQIRALYTEQFGISEKDWALFASRLKPDRYPKKKIILRAGETESNLTFLETGIVRYYLPKPESELTFGFTFEGSFFSAYDSFLTRKPSAYTIETLSECVVWRLAYDDLQCLYRETDIGNFIGRRTSEELFIRKSQRELALLNDSPEARYLNLFSERPELIRRIPLKYIASYIGVTPQALSRIRRRIS